MAKKKEAELEVVLISNLLAVPEVLNINGLEVSTELVKQAVEKAMTLKIRDKDDKEGYEKIKEQWTLCRKLRTQSEAWRKAGSKPIQEFLSAVKSKTDSFGAEAKKGEEYLKGEIDKYDNWMEEEKQRKAAEKLKKYNERIAKLATIGGKVDENGVYHFDFDEVNTINTIQLNDFDDEEFEEVYLDLKNGFDLQEKERKDEEERLLNEKNQVTLQVAANNEKRTKLRRKELLLEDFEHHEAGVYIKNSVSITEEQLLSAEDDEWDASIAKANGEAVEETPAAVEPEPDKKTDSSSPVNNFGSIAMDFEEETLPQPCIRVELEFTSSNPFIDVAIGPTFTQRIYPAEFEYEANDGLAPDTIALSGNINKELSFILIKK